jgi:hypothetical protein
MSINFIYEGQNEWYATSFYEVFNGQICEEIHWCTIHARHGKAYIVWEDGHREERSSIDDAKEYVSNNHFKHTPSITGTGAPII